MYQEILKHFESFSAEAITEQRKEVLKPLANYLKEKANAGETIRLNFICTHNSRRSHLAQIWAQTLAYHFGIKNTFCYSGGTEATAMFPKIAETLVNQGFRIQKLSETENAVYAVKYALNEMPVICFSKTYNSEFNPKNNFAAILTCGSADETCPMVTGADSRFAIKYNDPKLFDETEQQNQMYAERSLEIAQELWYVFSLVQN